MAQLNVNIGNLALKNPVMTASGTFGYGLEFADFIDLNRLGGFIVKAQPCTRAKETTTRAWPKHPRVCSTASDCKTRESTTFANIFTPQLKDIDSNVL